MTDHSLIVWDYVAIAAYFLLTIIVGIYALCRANRSSINGYFLADRYMWWLPIGASIFVSNVGSEHFVGLAGSGAASGIAVGAFPFLSIILLQLLGWIFVPVFIASGVRTVPEYMMKRFGGQRIQIYLSVLSLILYIFAKISVDLYSGALFIHQAFHWDIYLCVFSLLILTAVFTAAGGLTAVIYTDTLQFFVVLIGASIVMVKAFIEVGGYSALQYKYMQASPLLKYENSRDYDALQYKNFQESLFLKYENSSCGIPRRDAWTMMRDPVNSDLPWPAFILGQAPASIWLWCADQMTVQRVLSARSLSQAQGATLFAGYMNVLPLFLFVLPGMISRVLFPDDVACVLPEECFRACGSRTSCYNSAYPRLVVGIMPPGLKGLILSVMLAALMSDLTSIFSSASTLFTIDIWKKIRPNTNTKELLIIGKLFVVLLVAVSVAWVPIIEELPNGQLFMYIQMIAAYFAPPISCIYLLAVLWSRINEAGAFWALMIGFTTGTCRMLLDFVYPSPECYEIDERPYILSRVNFMYFAAVLFWFTGLCAVIISLLTEPPTFEKLIRTTYSTRFDETDRPDENWKLKEVRKTGYHSTDETNQAQITDTSNISNSRWRKYLTPHWVCGLDVMYTEEEEQEMSRKSILYSLNQERRPKLFLNFNLVFIGVVAISLFTYFSVDPFPRNGQSLFLLHKRY